MTRAILFLAILFLPGQFTLRDAAGEQFALRADHNWVIRLSSGKLAALGWQRVEEFAKVEGGAQMGFFLRVSEDDGRTWSEQRPIQLPEERYHIKFVNRTPIQLRSGRIVVPVCNYFGKAPEYDFSNRPFQARGAWGSHVFYSDDEGLTWNRSHDDVVVHMADFGYADMWATFVEPSVIELQDGRVMLIGRTWGNFKNLYALNDYNYIQPAVTNPVRSQQ